MTAGQLTKFLHGRVMLAISVAAVALCALVAYGSGRVTALVGDRGMLFESPNLWIADPAVSMWVNVGATLGIAALMILLNRTYNLLRTVTLLDATFFLVMSLGVPSQLVQFNTGSLLCIVLLACMSILYSTYGDPSRTRRIFLLFVILSSLTMVQYCFALYALVFVIGVIQMRIFTMRTLVAIILGIITPWWIVLGFFPGLVHQIHLPGFDNLFDLFRITENVHLFVAAALTMLVLVAGWVLNIPQMIAYNAHMRAFNGSLSVISLFTLLVIFADFTNIAVYMPVLYMCASFYAGRFLAAKNRPRSCYTILAILVMYIALYVWAIQ